jgi:probable rRNA maturation factor
MKKNHRPTKTIFWQLWEKNQPIQRRHWLRKYFAGLQNFFKGLARINIVLLNDKEIRRLNRQFLKRRGSTDVLAFRYFPEELPEPVRAIFPDGDIFINSFRAKTQAKFFGNTPRQEVLTLLIHGLLHLTGYNDQNKSERKKMFARQAKIQKWINCPGSC